MAINNLNQTRFLQPLRSGTLANKSAAITALEEVAEKITSNSELKEKADGITIVARYYSQENKGYPINSIFGIYSNDRGDITIYSNDDTELDKKFKSIDTAIKNAEDAAKAAATKLVLGDGENHLELTPTEGENGAITYILTSVDVASATALSAETSARTAADDALEEKIDAVSAAAKSYSIVEVKEGLGTNIGKAYQLQETVGNESKLVGSLIEIEKDDSLVSVSLVNESGNEVEDGQYLQFVYNLSDGTEKTVKIDVSHFLAESEFGYGLQVSTEGIVSVKVDDSSEDFLTVSENGVKLSGVQEAINAVKSDLNNVIAGLDAEVSVTANTLVNGSIEEVDGKLTKFTIDESKLSTEINGIKGNIESIGEYYLKNITVNGQPGTVVENVASVEIKGGNVEVGDYVETTYSAVSNVTFETVTSTDKVNAALKKIDSNVAKLLTEVLKDEEVTAAALNAIRTGAGLNDNGAYVANSTATYITDAESLKDADDKLDAAIKDLKAEFDEALGEGGSVSKQITTAIDALDVEDEEVLGQYVVSVSEEDGIVLNVKKSLVSSANKNDMLVADTTNGGLTLSNVWDCGTFDYNDATETTETN